MKKITPRVMTGLDGDLYLVFNNSYECEDYQAEHPEFHNFPVACFGQYENALRIVPDTFPQVIGHA